MDRDIKAKDEKVLKQYAEAKEKIAVLEKVVDGLKPQVIEMFSDYQMPALDTEFGMFTMRVTKKWSYSPRIEAMETKLKAEKAKEQINGDAVASESQTVAFTA